MELENFLITVNLEGALNRKSDHLNYFPHFLIDSFVVCTIEYFPSMATVNPIMEMTGSL